MSHHREGLPSTVIDGLLECSIEQECFGALDFPMHGEGGDNVRTLSST